MINLDSNDYVINKKDQKLLKQFEKQVLNSQILYPFHPFRHINCEFFHFIKGSGKDLLLDSVMQPKKSNVIFSELLFISYKYLAKVRYDIDDYFLRKNWVNLINVLYTNDIITDVSSFLTKIDEANKLEFN